MVTLPPFGPVSVPLRVQVPPAQLVAPLWVTWPKNGATIGQGQAVIVGSVKPEAAAPVVTVKSEDGRIVIIADWLPPDFGAVGQYMLLRARALAARGHEVTLVGLSSAADSTRLTVQSQMYSMFIQAVSTALKSMGEGQTAMARKSG